MAKKQKKRPPSFNNVSQPETKEFSERTINIYKTILRVMSWAVGVCFILIIILHLFNNPVLDVIGKYLFRFGVLNLIAFTFLEFIGDTVKQKIEGIIKVSNESKSTSS